MIRNPVRLLLGNPVVLKELRGRMRGPRAFVVLTGYLTLIAGFTLLLYLGMSRASLVSTQQIDGGEIGRQLFRGVVAVELFLVIFIAPAFTAGAISGERERQTYDLLRTTLLPEGHLVMGKLFSALAYIFLLLLAAIPLQSISFILGGTDLPDMLIAILTLTVTAIFLGNVGVYFSARTKRTLPASIATYGVALTLIVGTGLATPIVAAIMDSLVDNRVLDRNVETGMLVLLGSLVCLNPVATLEVTRDYLVSEQNPWTFKYSMDQGGHITLLSPWIVFNILYLLISVIFFILTIRRIKKVDEI